MNNIEVELKALANTFDVNVLLKTGYIVDIEEYQLNHYFNLPDTVLKGNLLNALAPYLTTYLLDKVSNALMADKFSIRTREEAGAGGNMRTLFIIKYAINDGTAENGKVRGEVEAEVDISLDTLDDLLLGAGLTYASKWSRNRVIYRNYNNTFDHLICLDTNAGYGKVLEIESVVKDPDKINETKTKLTKLLNSFGLSELDSELLENMFAFYQKHWQDYYGTNKLIWDDPRFTNSLG